MSIFRFGRKPRAFNPRIPHYSALRYATAAPVIVPTSYDWTTKLPANLGMMLNDQLGCCAEAAYYHAVQTWSSAAQSAVLTEPDSCVEQLYETQGYNPNAPLVNGQNPTDQGTVLQSLLTYLVQTGAPMASGSPQKLLAFVEIDPSNTADLNRATYEGGLVYFGTNIPQYIAESYMAPGSIWDVHPELDNSSAGGHCIITSKYNADGSRGFDSWGSSDYLMTPAFWAANVDEAYALVSSEFIEATGITPLGQTEAFWAAQMTAIAMPLQEAA